MIPSHVYANVVLPLPIEGLFTYIVPEHMVRKVRPGMRAIVQFGKKKLFTSLVIEVHSITPGQDVLKELLDLPDTNPLVLPSQIQFWQWMSTYYMCSIGSIFKAALPAGLRPESESRIRLSGMEVPDDLNLPEQKIINTLEERQSVTVHELAKYAGIHNPLPSIHMLIQRGSVHLEEMLSHTYKPKREAFIFLKQSSQSEEKLQITLDGLNKSPKQKAAFECFLFFWNQHSNHAQGIPLKRLKNDPQCTISSIGALIKKKILEKKYIEVGRLSFESSVSEELKILSDEQHDALKIIRDQFQDKNTVLLHGVTSSGKTEIYAHLIREQIELGKQVLYLLPEIALTSQIIMRLKKYFGHRIGVYHSRYTDAERVEIWKNLMDSDPDEQFQVILGVRSSIFLPFRKLGLIIVDEEQEPSYKQQDPSPRYHARDAALFLGHMLQAKVLLGTATPSLESYSNARSGKFGFVKLNRRFGNIQMPEIILANTHDAWKKKRMVAHFTQELYSGISHTLDQSGQVILFQNRRGFSPYLQCQECGWIPDCKNCDVHLTYHKNRHSIICHYCGYSEEVPALCNNCRSSGIKTMGMGTEKIEEETSILFPQARIRRMDLDTTRSKRAYHKILSDLENQKIDILIGTQMVSKGLDFEKVQLVGILNADNLLNFPDFRSYERTFHMLTQVSGRAGRKDLQGKVIIQTSNPDHPVIQWVLREAYEDMYHDQIAERKRFKYPPFFRLIQITLKHRNETILNTAGTMLAQTLHNIFKDRILGPEAPIISKIQGRYLKVIYLKLDRNFALVEAKQQLKQEIIEVASNKYLKSLQITVDVDPM